MENGNMADLSGTSRKYILLSPVAVYESLMGRTLTAVHNNLSTRRFGNKR